MNNHSPDVTHDEVNIDEFMAKYDTESDFRRFDGLFKWVVAIIAISFSLFQVYTGLMGSLDAHLQRAVHLSFAMALVYLLYPTRKSWSRKHLHPLDAFLAIVATALPLYTLRCNLFRIT